MIKNLNIKNYKSIKDLNLNARKINLFIGKPNVGKSNILEAISLFQNGIGNNIRKEDLRNLFFDQDIDNPIKVSAPYDDVYISYNNQIDQFFYIRTELFDNIVNDQIYKPTYFYNTLKNYDPKDSKKSVLQTLGEEVVYKFYKHNGTQTLNFDNAFLIGFRNVKPYLFKKGSFNNNKSEDTNLQTLAHPFGENLFTVLKNNRPLLREVSELFKEYGYNLVIDFVSDQAEIQKNVDGVIYKIPFILIADTLQRMIFHTCAIRSNKDNVLLFEEPENHSFPPYIKRLAYEIIEDESNQFFIATHSPYLFDTIVAEAPTKDVAVHIVTFENFQTKTRLLTSEEISNITNYGIDVFFNLNLFSNES